MTSELQQGKPPGTGSGSSWWQCSSCCRTSSADKNNEFVQVTARKRPQVDKEAMQNLLSSVQSQDTLSPDKDATRGSGNEGVGNGAGEFPQDANSEARRRAVQEGLSVTFVSEDGEIRPGTFSMEGQLKLCNLSLSGEAARREPTEFFLARLTELRKPKPEMISMVSELPQTIRDTDTLSRCCVMCFDDGLREGGSPARLHLLFENGRHRNTFYTCMKVLRMLIDMQQQKSQQLHQQQQGRDEAPGGAPPVSFIRNASDGNLSLPSHAGLVRDSGSGVGWGGAGAEGPMSKGDATPRGTVPNSLGSITGEGGQ
uniref:Uncharacterized protein n=1 Tax=Chromera velia CCMP2878 TaxID=1169474 RepID=A0A0G4FKF3_9ALVE|eukprot:Cvel_17422.t1-p1 / transcript=Cvel_17422.t1 / gene=Cvel_17422 / organism=Chromera_velia_CCMP2878 / gene_product=hypothetical protein / transcript_product=hypothetical protein / location=Cvel_scaffold1388:26290-29736(-) / protein_length=312 / sequence_SO=supercontig / SO=protein_coding / is_pseudo=false